MVMQGILTGLNDYIENYLNIFGFNNLNHLSEADLEKYLNTFVSILINQTDPIIIQQLNYNPYDKIDTNLQDKFAHLTQNLMIVITFQFDNFLSNNSNNNENNNLVNCLQQIVLDLLINIQKSFGIIENDMINQIISNLVANYINDLIQDPNSTKQLIQTVLNYLENSAIDLLNLLLNFLQPPNSSNISNNNNVKSSKLQLFKILTKRSTNNEKFYSNTLIKLLKKI